MTVLRFHLLLGTALIVAAGCAQQPQRVDQAAAPTAAPATPASAAATLELASRSIPPRLVAFAYEQGYRQLVVEGKNYYFCRIAAPIGSVIPEPLCINQLQLGAVMDGYYAWKGGGGTPVQSSFSPP